MQFLLKKGIYLGKSADFLRRIVPSKAIHAIDPQIDSSGQFPSQFHKQGDIGGNAYPAHAETDTQFPKLVAYCHKGIHICHLRVKGGPETKLSPLCPLLSKLLQAFLHGKAQVRLHSHPVNVRNHRQTS